MKLQKINTHTTFLSINILYTFLVLRTSGVYYFNNDDSMALLVAGISAVALIVSILGFKKRPYVSYLTIIITSFLLCGYYTLLLIGSRNVLTTILMQAYSFFNFIILFTYWLFNYAKKN